MIINNSTKETRVADHILHANTFWKRLIGLLGTRSLAVGDGLLIKPCSSIHTFGMAYSIDVLFVDQDHRIIKIITQMPARRLAMKPGSSYVIELPGGTANQALCSVGDLLHYQ